MASTIRPEIFQRLVLGRSLLAAATSACAARSDQITFARGILLLHDAVESVLGAIADHVHAVPKPQTFLLDYYQVIQEADPQNRMLPFKTQMRNLNQLRVNTKHLGLLPDPKANAHFPGTVESFCQIVCETYLEVDFASTSLTSLIRKGNVKDWIDRAEHQIGEGDYKQGLISLAYAMFHACEISSVSGLAIGLPPKSDSRISFPDIYTTQHTVELVGHGVDPYLYHRFKNLTPRIGRDNDTGHFIDWGQKDFWHPANWSQRNAKFCLDFCIETALKFQRDADEGYTIVSYRTVYEDLIEPSGESATFWNLPSKPQWPTNEPRKEVFILHKGQSIVGVAWDDEDRMDVWWVLSADLPKKGTVLPGTAYVTKEEVSITSRERRESRPSP